MLSVASHIRLAPYLAVTLGPISHSPPAIDDPPISSPGPIRPTQLRHVNRGASGSSPRDHAGMPATVSRVVVDGGFGHRPVPPALRFGIRTADARVPWASVFACPWCACRPTPPHGRGSHLAHATRGVSGPHDLPGRLDGRDRRQGDEEDPAEQH